MVKADPRLLVWQGVFLESGMRDERVNRDEVLAAIRAQGIARLEKVGAVVLETDGSMTVTEGSPLGDSSALCDVKGTPGNSVVNGQ
ncbi:MAG: YetF domain-containing protein [Bryobacteraceae bacterium]